MFQGGGGPSMSHSVFTEYLNNVAKGRGAMIDPTNIEDEFGNARQQAVGKAAVQKQQMEEDMAINGMEEYAQYKGQGRGMPAFNRAQQTGYENVQNPALFDKETLLPFNEVTDKSKNFAGIVNSYDPRLFQASEQMIKQVTAMGPAAEKAVAYRGSIYQGVSDDFMTNRLYIANTRRRENDVYVFV